ncbi:MAG: PEGA domain-containing protein [Polyangiaceae bacterium]
MAPHRSRSLALFLTLSVASASAPALAQPAPPNEIAAGDKSARTKDWEGALTHYQAALHATPSWRAQLGVADALYQLGRLGESYETYDDAQRTYGTKYGPGEKGLVNARLKELAAKTGWLSIRIADAGADVELDGKAIGTSPVPALIRVAVGSHGVHVTKAGFAPFAGRADVTADGKAVVDVALSPQATQGHVIVHASGSDVLRVTIDGVDVGATPWEGDVSPGPHQIGGRGSMASATPQTVDVAAGARVTVDLPSASTAAHIQVRTNDGKGLIYIDGAIKGEGAFAGDVTPGPHTVVVSRDGYERYEKSMTLAANETSAETVTLTPVASVGPSGGSAERKIEGIYGGVALLGLFGVGGMGTELETGCATLGATSCTTPSPIGGGAFGYAGWTWDPVGFEVMVGGGADTVQQTAHFTGLAPSGAALPASMPARNETFTFVRAGGLGAFRARATFQGSVIRATFAGGLGFSYKVMLMQRTATTTAEQPQLSTTYVPSAISYVSPALTLEAAIHFRASPILAIAVGLELWAENASIAGTNSTPPGPPEPLGNPNATANSPNATPQFIATPAYHLATGPQVFLGPFVGLQFGP